MVDLSCIMLSLQNSLANNSMVDLYFIMLSFEFNPTNVLFASHQQNTLGL